MKLFNTLALAIIKTQDDFTSDFTEIENMSRAKI